jgi:hypothetical protein
MPNKGETVTLFQTILGRTPDTVEVERYTREKYSYSDVCHELATCREKYIQLHKLSGERLRTSISYSEEDIEDFFSLVSGEKKIAICLSGHLRDYNINLPSIEKFLAKPLKADVFLHTWDTIGKQIRMTKGVVGPIPDEKEENIPDVSKYLSNLKKIKIENNSIFLKKLKYLEEQKFYLYGMELQNEFYGGQAEPKYIFSQFYSINQSFKLMEEWETKNSFNYDYVIKLRADYCLTSGILLKDFTFLEKNENVIFIPNLPYSNHGHPSCCMCAADLPHAKHVEDVCDVFAYGKRKEMEKYFAIYENLENLRSLQEEQNLSLQSKKEYALGTKENFVLCDIWSSTNYDINCFYPERLFRDYLNDFHLEPSKMSGMVIR